MLEPTQFNTREYLVSTFLFFSIRILKDSKGIISVYPRPRIAEHQKGQCEIKLIATLLQTC